LKLKKKQERSSKSEAILEVTQLDSGKFEIFLENKRIPSLLNKIEMNMIKLFYNLH